MGCGGGQGWWTGGVCCLLCLKGAVNCQVNIMKASRFLGINA